MMRHYPDRIVLGACENCGAGPHEFCSEDCEQTYRLDPRLTDCEDD
jgi:hypothetical protein